MPQPPGTPDRSPIVPMGNTPDEQEDLGIKQVTPTKTKSKKSRDAKRKLLTERQESPSKRPKEKSNPSQTAKKPKEPRPSTSKDIQSESSKGNDSDVRIGSKKGK